MKIYEDTLNKLVELSKEIRVSTDIPRLMWLDNELLRHDVAIETQWRSSLLPNGEYQTLHGCILELQENLRHVKRLKTLRRELGYAPLVSCIDDFLDD